jgi:hypothetical protein
MLRVPALVLAIACSAPAGAQDVIYVDRDATGVGDGTSWANAYPTVQQAISASTNGDEIWVAEGVYVPGIGPTAAYNLRGGVALYGGFDGTETTRDQRDPAVHVTALSGDIGVAGDSLDNSNTIVRAIGTGPGTRVDGFTIAGAQGGNGVFVEGSLAIAQCRIVSNYSSTRGGGVVAFSVALTIEDTVIEDNRAVQAGGGLYMVVGSVLIDGTVFRNNTVMSTAAGAGGGGLYLEGTVDAVVRDAEFVENTAVRGAGLYSRDAGLAVVRARFVRNAGGGAYVTRRSSFYNVSLLGNTAVTGTAIGGGIAAEKGTDSLFVYNSAFVGNGAGRGGGIYLGPGVGAVVANVTFAENAASVAGDAAFADAGAHGDLRNAVLWQSEVAPAGAWTHDHTTEENPLYTAAPSPGPDGRWGTVDDDYGDLRPGSGSPVIDAGLTAHLPPDAYDLDNDGNTAELLPLDLAEQPRVAGPAVDLGAYEGQSPVASGGGPSSGYLRLAISPNPAHDAALVSLVMPARTSVVLALYDPIGRRLAVLHSGVLVAGRHQFTLPLGRFGPGVYVLRATTPEATGTVVVTLTD